MRGLSFVLALALFSLPVFASLSLQSFSCNSQSGTVTVENGVSFNCQAAIKNDGSSATNLTGVTLSLPSPVWSESSSYSGTGYSSSVQAGATTTATFSGIRSVLSGSQSFNTVSATPSGALDADVSSTNINVVSIKTVSLSSPASAAPGEQFSVSATVTVGGSLPVTASIALTGGACSLVSGESSGKSLGTMNNDVPSATSWALVQGASGNCSFTVTASSGAYSPKNASGQTVLGSDITAPILSSVSASALTTSSAVVSWVTNEFSTTQVEYGLTASYGSSTTLDATSVKSHSVLLSGLSTGTVYYYRVISVDSSNNTAVSGVYSFTTSSPATAGSGSGGSGTASGASVAAALKETRTIAAVEPGVPGVFNFTKPGIYVSAVRLFSLGRLYNVSVSVEMLGSRPAVIAESPAAEVYKYIELSSTATAASLGKVKIKFKVESSWAGNFSSSTIYLNRYSSGWSRLHTVFLSADSNYSYFEAESPGFSTFAITGERPVAAPASPPVEEPAKISPSPTGFTPVVSLVTQSDITRVFSRLNAVSPQTDEARSLLAQARAKVEAAQAAFDAGEQARAKQLLDDANALIQEASGLRSMSVSRGKTSIFTVLLILVVLMVGVYAYYTRPPPREDALELARLRKEKDEILREKKAAGRQYLTRKIDEATYKRILSDSERKLVELNTRIEKMSRRNN